MIKQTIQRLPWRYYLIMPLWSNKQYKHFHGCIISWCPYDQANNTNISMEVLSHNTPMIKQTIQTFSMEVLSDSTPMIKQTIQTFPWRYYLIMPHDQTNNTNISMEILSHSTPMIKQTIHTLPWRYYLIVPLWSNKQYKHFHGGIIS